MKWGPEQTGPGRWTFRLWAPALEQATLEIDGRAPVPMRGSDQGWFTAQTDAAAGDRYRFRIRDDLTVPDPASRGQDKDVHGWSLVPDANGHAWRSEGCRGRPWEQAIIYELHAGLCGGFAGVERELPRLVELGVTAIELMPIAETSGSRNWGYDGVLPYAPERSYGTPSELKALIDRAHELGLMVLLDVVYNHFGPDGNYISLYAPDFFHPELATPWGAAIAFDREPVRRFFVDNALMWLNEYGFDGLRFDAVHAIEDASFLDFLSEGIRDGTDPGRHIHLILENEYNDAGRLESAFAAQWNDDFHNSLHVLLTGETRGYYAGFADAPTDHLARCLGEGFAYQGEIPPGRDRPRGTPSGHLPATAFVSFLQNHDQVGNRAFGERLTRLTDPARLRVATALLLLCPQIPLLFMGEEVGSESPFLFFTDFHDALADAVREGRRGEFAAFEAFADPAKRAQIPDPNAYSTFEHSRVQTGPDGEAWFNLYKRLIGLRREQIVPRLKGAHPLGAEVLGEGAIRARWRMGDGKVLSILLNIGPSPVEPGLGLRSPFFSLGDVGAPTSFAAWLEDA